MQRRLDAEPSDASITVLPNGCSLLLPRHFLPEGACIDRTGKTREGPTAARFYR